jgi:hypothetical protein
LKDVAFFVMAAVSCFYLHALRGAGVATCTQTAKGCCGDKANTSKEFAFRHKCFRKMHVAVDVNLASGYSACSGMVAAQCAPMPSFHIEKVNRGSP